MQQNRAPISAFWADRDGRGDCKVLMLDTPAFGSAAVAAPHHLASEAGRAILAEGGNAIEAMVAMAATAFGEPVPEGHADDVLGRLATQAGMEIWVAEAAGEMVSAGRLELVPAKANDGWLVWKVRPQA